MDFLFVVEFTHKKLEQFVLDNIQEVQTEKLIKMLSRKAKS
jgi:hypothetical protein